MRALTLLLIILLFTGGCSREQGDIKFGIIGVLSGRYSEVGVASRNGAELAIDNINAAGGINGRRISVVSLDDKNDKKTVAEAFETHIKSGTTFIIGPNISHLADETLHFAAPGNILIISPTLSADKLDGIDDYFFRVISTTSYEGMALSEKAKKMGLKKAAVVFDSSNAEYADPIYRTFRNNFEKDGYGKIVYVNQVQSGIRENFLEMSQNIKESGADTLLILTSAIDAAYIAQQIRKSDKSIQLFAARWAKTLDIISQGGSAVEGMIFTSMYTPAKRTEKYIKFADEYHEKYNTMPSFVAAYAYETVMVLADAIKKAGTTDIAKVKEAIITTGVFKGLEEDILINKYGDADRKSSLVKIHNGVFEVIDD